MPSTSTDIASNADLPKIIDNGESNNYAEWKTRSCRKLHGWGLWKYIEGPDSTPPEIPILQQTTIQKGKDKQGVIQEFTIDGNSAKYDKKTEEAKPWLAGNELTLDKIIDAMPSEILPLVQNVPYAKQAWEVLRSTYQPRNAMRAVSVMGDITSYRCTPDMDISLWLNNMQRQFNILQDMDPAIMSDHDFMVTVLNNMPQTNAWQTTVASLHVKIKECDEHKPALLPVNSFEYIANIHKVAWFRNRNNSQLASQASAHVFTTRSEAKKKGLKWSRTSLDSSTQGSAKRPRVFNDKLCTNTYCTTQKGHTFAECIAYMGGSQGKYTLGWRGPWNVHLPTDQCNRGNNVPLTSHPAYAKYVASSSSKPSAVYFTHSMAQPQDPNAHYTQDSNFQLSRMDTSASITTEDSKPVIHVALCHETPGHTWLDNLDNEVLVATVPVLEDALPILDACYHDTGANRHVFHDKAVFETYQNIDPVAVKGFGKNIAIPAIGCGTVCVEGRYGTRKCTMLLKDALHIPAARCNLISGVQLDKISVTATTGSGLVSLAFQKINIVGGAPEGEMYRLNMTILRPSADSHQSNFQQPLATQISPMAAAASLDQQGFYIAYLAI